MKNPFKRDLPTGAAAAIVALALLAGAVTGRDQAPVPEVVPPSPEKQAAPPAAPIGELDLKKLVRERKERLIQDLFANPAPPAPAAAAAPAPVVVKEPESPPAPTAPPLPFSYLGQMKNGKRTIVYLLKNEELLLAETGQTVETDFRVEDISDSAVLFVYLPLGTKQILSVPPPPQ